MQGMGEFLNEMVAMMSETQPSVSLYAMHNLVWFIMKSSNNLGCWFWCHHHHMRRPPVFLFLIFVLLLWSYWILCATPNGNNDQLLKYVALWLIALLTFTLCGCGSHTNTYSVSWSHLSLDFHSVLQSYATCGPCWWCLCCMWAIDVKSQIIHQIFFYFVLFRFI